MERVPFLAANDAHRASTAAALTKPRTPTELRVLLAVQSLTVAWCKLEDRVTIEQIAKAAGVDNEHRSRVLAALRQLADDGAIVYRPGKGGRGKGGVVGVPAVQLPDERGASSGPGFAPKGGPILAERGASSGPGFAPKGGPAVAPHPRSTASTSKKKGGAPRRHPFTAASWNDAKGGLTKL